MIHSFEPIVGPNPKILILGSMPSVKSLEAVEYYGHPRNQFWPLMGQILGADIPREHLKWPYKKKLTWIQSNGVSIWDVLKSCEREGSLDSDIRNEVPNDIVLFLNEHPSIKLIVFNGGKAESAFKKFFKDIYASGLYEIVKMPSTSPAYTLGFEKKLDQWLQIKKYL